MLQQTQVRAGDPEVASSSPPRYPTPAACAAASLGDVLRLWQGLGYPRRARNLRDAAALDRRQRRVPLDARRICSRLPGVGQYTARAVLAFAFEADAAVVDTNIARVFARLAGRRLTAKQAQAAADAALRRGASWAWNQSLMDLGAVLCRPVSPRCEVCPLAGRCAWRGSGEDPSVGSAGVSTRQSRFDGSDRQARGRLLKALVSGPVPIGEVADGDGSRRRSGRSPGRRPGRRGPRRHRSPCGTTTVMVCLLHVNTAGDTPTG